LERTIPIKFNETYQQSRLIRFIDVGLEIVRPATGFTKSSGSGSAIVLRLYRVFRGGFGGCGDTPMNHAPPLFSTGGQKHKKKLA
jgi:hypothetical protein